MNAQFWQRLSQELDGLLDSGPDERAARLDELDAEEPALASRLRAALEADTRGIDLLDAPLSLDLASNAEAAPAAKPVAGIGDRVGSWRLERALGQGGMGQVWLAARDDGQYRLEVAIKLIDGVPDSDLAREQLRRERQILADLDHPDIARLLDGGVRDNGTPWYAMEYVEGQPLDAWCRQHDASIRSRLGLLARIARAVHHAHTRLVVHRDLKPGNILVDDRGRPHLLDFGIAKLLDAGDAASGPLTLLAAATPAYAAPEQLRGERVGTAADIYALGVIAFELLTDARPPQPDPTRQDDVCGPYPSSAVDARSHRVLLRGDVDAIVARALAPHPAQRYPSAEALADDIEHCLKDEPVDARHAGTSYRARKFVRRHAWGVGLGTVAMLALCAALAASIVQARRARIELTRSTAVQDFLLGVFDAAQPLAGNSGVMTQRDLADKASSDLDRMLADQPRARIDLLIAIGRVYRKLGLADRSRRLLQRAAAELDQVHAAADDPRRIELLLALGRAEYELADMNAAITALSQANALAHSRGVSANMRASILYELGSSYSAAGQWQQALDTLDLAEQQAQGEGGAPNLVPKIHIERSLALYRTVRLDAAITEGERALEAAVTQYGPDDTRTTGILSTLGGMQRRAGHLKRAEALLRRAVAIEKKSYGQPQPATTNNLANILAEQGNFSEAGPLFELALKLAIQRYGADSVAAASYRRNLAGEQADAGLLDKAEANLHQAYAIVEARTRPDSLENLTMREQLASLLLRRGKHEDAAALLPRILAHSPSYDGVPGINLRLALRDAAQLALDRHELDAARQHLAAARRGLPAHSPDIPDQVRLGLLAGDIAQASGQTSQARKEWRAAAQLARQRLGPSNPLGQATAQRLIHHQNKGSKPSWKMSSPTSRRATAKSVSPVLLAWREPARIR